MRGLSLLTVPAELLPLMGAVALLCSKPVGTHAPVVWVGAMLATGKRTVTACWRVMGLSQEPCCVNDHRVLHRARWSALAAGHLVLRGMSARFAPAGEWVFGLDDPIERRRGEPITAQGLSRDPGRSSQAHCVKASGLRWLACMVLVNIPWAGALWGLPCLPALCPSERDHAERGRTHHKLPARARHILRLLTRWLPDRQLVFVGDSRFAVLARLNAARQTPKARVMTRWRLEAELWSPAPARRPGPTGRPRVKGAHRPSPQQRLEAPTTPWTPLEVEPGDGGEKRESECDTATCIWYQAGCPPVLRRWVLGRDPHGTYQPQAFLSTHVDHTPLPILTWCVRRWRMEVTCEEARAHLGIETQRPWSDVAIARTTPVLLGMFSIVTLLADSLSNSHTIPVRTAAWYTQAQPTFAEAMARVRRCLWSHCHFSMSHASRNVVQIPRSVFERLTDAVCYAA